MHKHLRSEGNYLDQNSIERLARLRGMTMGMIMDCHLNSEPRRLSSEGWTRYLEMVDIPLQKNRYIWLTVGLDTTGVSGNRMAGSSEVTELVMLVSVEKCFDDSYVQTRSNRAIYCLDLELELIGGCKSGWSSNQYEDTVIEQVKTNVEFRMKFEEFDHLGQDWPHRVCFASIHMVHSVTMLWTQQMWRSWPLSREATPARRQANARLQDNNDPRHSDLVELSCPVWRALLLRVLVVGMFDTCG